MSVEASSKHPSNSEDISPSEWPLHSFYYKKSILTGYCLLLAAMLWYGVYLGFEYFHHETLNLKEVIYAVLGTPIALVGLVCIIRLLVKPMPILKFDIIGIYPRSHIDNDSGHKAFNCIPWSNIESISLVDVSHSWLMKNWQIQIFFKEGVPTYPGKKVLRYVANSNYDYCVPASGLDKEPHRLLALMRKYHDEGAKRGIR